MTTTEISEAMDSFCNVLERLPDVKVYGHYESGSVSTDCYGRRVFHNQSFKVDMCVTTFRGVEHLKNALSHGKNANGIKCKIEVTEAKPDCLTISITSSDIHNLDHQSIEKNICKTSDRIRSYINEHAHEWKEPVSGK